MLGQRLARRLCDRCKEPFDPGEELLVAAGWSPELVATASLPGFHRAVGCQACTSTGYRGRFAIHEVLLSSEELCRLVIAGAHTEDVSRLARAEGMRTMREDGLVKAAHGMTTLEELSRVVR